MSDLSYAKAQLMSTANFVKILENLGIEISTKVSNTGNIIPALAKSDDFMTDLLEHPDERVQAVTAARLGVKSTLEEKRCERLLSIARLPWHVAKLPPATMPIPLRYAGAHTQRLSGDWKINMQNLPSGRGTTSTALRDTLQAPPGHKVVVCDLGQIEARLTAWLTRAPLLRTFHDGKDPYCAMASEIFGFEVTKANEIERFVGKSAVLGLGFGLGAENFHIKTAAAARAQGLAIGDMWTEDLARRTVGTYRKMQAPTVRFWSLLQDKLNHEWLGKRAPVQIGPIEIGHGYIGGPSGLRMFYNVGEEVEDPPPNNNELWYKYGGRWRKIYGAAALENIIQFLARIIQMNAALRLQAYKLSFLRIVHTVHDELIFVVPDKYVDKAKELIHKEMTQRPSWGPDIPLKADIGHAQTYGGAKA
jgi:DNA polymerase family A